MPFFLSSTDEYLSAQYGLTVAAPVLMNFNGDPIEETAEWSFVGEDRPELFFRLLGPTSKILLDLVESETTFVPTITRRSLLDSRRMLHKVKRAQPATPTLVGSLAQYSFVVRDSPDSTEEGVGYNLVAVSASEEGFAFANGTQVPNGSYKVLLRALKVFGAETDAADYESWLSPTIIFGNEMAPVVGNSTEPEPGFNTTLTANSTASATSSSNSNDTMFSIGASNTTSSALP